MQLDPDLDLDQFDLKPAARIIARALQEYGMFLGDGADGFALYAENFTGERPDLWDGVLDSADLAAIPTRHLQVLTMPPLRHYDYSR
jgi:hypothetical protein